MDSVTGVMPSTPPSVAMAGDPSVGSGAVVNRGSGRAGGGGRGTCADAFKASTNTGTAVDQGRRMFQFSEPRGAGGGATRLRLHTMDRAQRRIR